MMIRSRLVAALVPSLAMLVAAAVSSDECRSLRGTDVCALSSTSFRPPDDVDSIRTVGPATPTDGIGVYFPIAPARSFDVGVDVFVREHVTGPSIEALARVSSSSARVLGNTSHAGVLAPLSVRIANVVPKGGKNG